MTCNYELLSEEKGQLPTTVRAYFTSVYSRAVVATDPCLSTVALPTLRKKVEPKRLHPGAVLEKGATLEGGKWHQKSATGGAESSINWICLHSPESVTRPPGMLC